MSAESRVAYCPMGYGDCPSDCENNKAATKTTNELGGDSDPFVNTTVVVLGVNPPVSLGDLATALARCTKEEASRRDSE